MHPAPIGRCGPTEGTAPLREVRWGDAEVSGVDPPGPPIAAIMTASGRFAGPSHSAFARGAWPAIVKGLAGRPGRGTLVRCPPCIGRSPNLHRWKPWKLSPSCRPDSLQPDSPANPYSTRRDGP